MTFQALWSELREYPRGVLEEMRKVSWPSLKQARTSTAVVIAIVAVSAVIIGGMDLVFSELVKVFLGA